MKNKKVFIGILSLALAFSSFGLIRTQAASAGQDDFILPYYNGYVEDGATIILQDTVIDMSGYNGVKGVGFDVGVVTVTSEYQITVMQEGAIFYLPYAGSLDDLNNVGIMVNGSRVVPERIYGDMPYYHAGLGGDSDTILESIASVKPSTLEGTGKLYTFETSEEPLEYSFSKTENQTVLHGGRNWSRTDANSYTIKYNTNTNEEYPYKLFVSEGELQNFIASVNYSVEEITHKAYLDYYIDELVEELGEEYRAILYSNFNRNLNGQVEDYYDIVYNYSSYVFTLLKIPIPIGNVLLTVNTKVKPMVNGLYKPYIYTVRTVSAYPQECAYSLEIKTPTSMPYVVEENIGLSKLKYEGKTQIADGYYIVSAEKKPDYVLDNKEERAKNWLWLWILLVVVVSVGAGLLVWWIWELVERRRSK